MQKRRQAEWPTTVGFLNHRVIVRVIAVFGLLGFLGYCLGLLRVHSPLFDTPRAIRSRDL